MARPEVIKTPLGQRLRAIRRQMGDPSRLEFAQRLGVTDKTLANHERGDSEPDASVLRRYREEFGINMNWLVSDTGEMFEDPSKAPAAIVNADLIEKLARIASAVHREAGIKLPPDRVSAEAATLYNELAIQVRDLDDTEGIEAALPLLRYQLKKRLAAAAAAPGTGKREAS